MALMECEQLVVAHVGYDVSIQNEERARSAKPRLGPSDRSSRSQGFWFPRVLESHPEAFALAQHGFEHFDSVAGS
jgi:hypothetical protein